MHSPSLPTIRPVPRVCAAPTCRRRVTLTTPRLYATIVANKQGGSQKEAAFDCPACSLRNAVPAALLPKGFVPLLPLRETWLLGQTAAAIDPPKAAATDHTPAPVASVRPAPAKAARAASTSPPTSTSTPAWATGVAARDLLDAALKQVRMEAATMAALRPGPGRLGLEAIDSGQFGANAAWKTSDLLDHLEAIRCDMLVITGSDSAKGPWMTIFHPRAGATSFIQPATASH